LWVFTIGKARGFDALKYEIIPIRKNKTTESPSLLNTIFLLTLPFKNSPYALFAHIISDIAQEGLEIFLN
jgi:hypothetical protein